MMKFVGKIPEEETPDTVLSEDLQLYKINSNFFYSGL